MKPLKLTDAELDELIWIVQHVRYEREKHLEEAQTAAYEYSGWEILGIENSIKDTDNLLEKLYEVKEN